MTYILEFVLQVLPLTDRSTICICPTHILLMDLLPTPLAYRKHLLCIFQQCLEVLFLVVSSTSTTSTMGTLLMGWAITVLQVGGAVAWSVFPLPFCLALDFRWLGQCFARLCVMRPSDPNHWRVANSLSDHRPIGEVIIRQWG